MKKILYLSLISFIFTSCGGPTSWHELIGAGEINERKEWSPTEPYGMVFVPQGSFVMGPSDQDVPFANVSTNQTVSVGAFYMDQSEITNDEYRQFVEWVEDSIIRSNVPKKDAEGKDHRGWTKAPQLNHNQEDGQGYNINWKYNLTEQDYLLALENMKTAAPVNVSSSVSIINVIDTSRTLADGTKNPNYGKLAKKYRNKYEYDYSLYKKASGAIKDETARQEHDIKYPNFIKNVGQDMFMKIDQYVKLQVNPSLQKKSKTATSTTTTETDTRSERKTKKQLKKEVIRNYFNLVNVDGKVVKNPERYRYKYEVIDYRALAAAKIKDPDKVYSDDEFNELFVIIEEIKIYPNTVDFQGDYTYSHEETEAEFNFIHEAYDDYPVVGVSWDQAVAFCHWRTHIMNTFRRDNNIPILPDFRLPTESEWEYAARGGLTSSPYPWGGPYTRSTTGCFLANFKPLRGNYTADGGLKAIKVESYNPNNFGLYDMAGNVAEWTSTAYDETSSSFSFDMDMDNSYNPGKTNSQDQNVRKRKVVRGGSWKDVAWFIQNSTRDYEYSDESTSYIGFRCVVDFLGRDQKDYN